MAINLTKGQTIDLRKDTNDLDQITIGLGWKVREKKKGFLGGIFGGKDEAEFDLDAVAFLLNDKNLVDNLGTDKLVGGDIVFFNSRQHPSGTVIHSGDNRTGGTGAANGGAGCGPARDRPTPCDRPTPRGRARPAGGHGHPRWPAL